FGGGLVTTAFGTTPAEAFALLLQPGGKVIAAGSTNRTTDGSSDFALVRYTSTGGLDGSFGPNGTGKVTTDLYIGPPPTSPTDDHAYALVQQSDLKLVVAGYRLSSCFSCPDGTATDFALVRYIPD